jgi:hypothetical protein
MGRTFFRV